jgi:hypothetical protein
VSQSQRSVMPKRICDHLETGGCARGRACEPSGVPCAYHGSRTRSCFKRYRLLENGENSVDPARDARGRGHGGYT